MSCLSLMQFLVCLLLVQTLADFDVRSQGTAYTYMTQSWVASLYLDCERAGMLSWPGSGATTVGLPNLHCPNASSILAFKAALRRGDIFLHAFPHDGEASYYPDSAHAFLKSFP